jgi:hypothetical protein
MHRLEKNILHHANKRREQRSSLPHYFINDNLFILFDEAIKFCDINNISYNQIKKSYKY